MSATLRLRGAAEATVWIPKQRSCDCGGGCGKCTANGGMGVMEQAASDSTSFRHSVSPSRTGASSASCSARGNRALEWRGETGREDGQRASRCQQIPGHRSSWIPQRRRCACRGTCGICAANGGKGVVELVETRHRSSSSSEVRCPSASTAYDDERHARRWLAEDWDGKTDASDWACSCGVARTADEEDRPARLRSLNVVHRGFSERRYWWARDDMSDQHVELMDEAFEMLNESNSLWSSLQFLSDYYALPGHSLRHVVNRDRHLSYLNGQAKLRFFAPYVSGGVAHSYVLDVIHINGNFLDAMDDYLQQFPPRRGEANQPQRLCVIAELASTIIHETAHAAGFIQGQGEGFAYLSEYYWKYHYLRASMRRGFLSSMQECCARNEPPSWFPEDYPSSEREDAARDATCFSAQRWDSDRGRYTWRNCSGGENC